MTETVADGKIVISSEKIPSIETIVPRKTIIYETRTDPTVIKLAGEKVKDQLFTRFRFFKPRPGDIQFVYMDKYYEPYIVISGKYSVDYYRKSTYEAKVDRDVLEIVILDHKITPSPPTDDAARDRKVIVLQAEERLTSENKAFLILDKAGNEVGLGRLQSAPSERDSNKILKESGVEEIAENADLVFLRSRVIRRPKDIGRLVKESFEVDERAVIYAPRFRVAYLNTKTGVEKTIEFDGVTGMRIGDSKLVGLPPPP